MCDLHSILVPRATRFKTTWRRNDGLWGQECQHSVSFFWACVTLVQWTRVMPSTIQHRPRVLFCRRHIGKGEDPGYEVDHYTKDEWNAQDAIWLRLFVPSITRYLDTDAHAFWVKLTAENTALEQEHFDFRSEAWISPALPNLLLLEALDIISLLY